MLQAPSAYLRRRYFNTFCFIITEKQAHVQCGLTLICCFNIRDVKAKLIGHGLGIAWPGLGLGFEFMALALNALV